MNVIRGWLEAQLEATSPSPVFAALTSPLAHLYGAAVRRRNAAYDTGRREAQRLPGRVVSIGNIAVGGTGKSPITIALAQRLAARGARPAIVARGYGAQLASDEVVVVVDGAVVWESHGRGARPSDEGRMQSAALPGVPIVLGANRHAAAAACIAHVSKGALPTHWLLDDGFQHRALARDADIVLVDAARPLGSGRLLPAGNLREGPTALARASLVIATRARDGSDAERVSSMLRPYYSGPVVAAPFWTALPGYDAAEHAPALLVAGIANPARFRSAIEDLGVIVGGSLLVPDHGALVAADLKAALEGCRSVVTTAKDYWRAPELFAGLPAPVLVADLAPKLDFALVDPLLFS
jgi:tetraacyldisaccharide 4'-kinase